MEKVLIMDMKSTHRYPVIYRQDPRQPCHGSFRTCKFTVYKIFLETMTTILLQDVCVDMPSASTWLSHQSSSKKTVSFVRLHVGINLDAVNHTT